MRLWFTRLAAAACCCLPLLAAAAPNIVVIYSDDHGWPDIGPAGINQDLRTPHLDQLAADGVYATNGYSTAPQCVPSRVGLLTGQYQNRLAVEANQMPLNRFNQALTIAERLKPLGYATGQVGKWHLGNHLEIPNHGFDDVYAKASNRPCFANFTLAGDTIPMQSVDDGLFHLDACSQAARAFIQRHHTEPFFLYLAYRAPHVPLDAPDRHLQRFPGTMPERRRQALAMIAAMDDGVGLIRDTLKAFELETNTLIFYIGDNGAPLKIHKWDAPGGGPGWDGSLNAPMKGEKGMLTEGGIRVPFLISWPGTIPPGQVYHHPITALDVAATAVSQAGSAANAGGALDGKDLVPFLTQTIRPPHESLHWRWIAQAALREDRWKYLVAGSREYLFDLETDRAEQHNRITEHPSIAKGMRQRLDAWTQELHPPGLATQAMETSWNQFYDFYLDGKPAPPRPQAHRPPPPSAQGWQLRNGTLEPPSSSKGLTISGAPNPRQPSPFLVRQQLQLKGPFQLEVTHRNNMAGRIAVGWRREGQADFQRDQVAASPVPASETWKQTRITVTDTQSIVHLRLFLPPGQTQIQSIRLVASGPSEIQSWQFGQ